MSARYSGAAGSGPPLVVRTRQAEYSLTSGLAYDVGRDPDADIVVPDARVSWRHAVFRHEPGGWVLEDAGSTNGTFAGGRRITRVAITADCVIRLGDRDDGPVLRCEPVIPAGHASTVIASQVRGGGTAVVAPARPGQIRAGDPPGQIRAGHPPGQIRAGHPPREAGPADYRLSVDRRPTAVLPAPGRRLRIGRTAGNDLVLSDLTVSRHHAELRKLASGHYEIADLGSHNGTFVNGRRITSATLTERDIVGIGHATFRLAGGELRQYIDTGDVSLAAQDLVVEVGGGKVLLDHVSFPIGERCLVGIIGPSGAGKSTLLGALTGMRPADRGVVLYDNRDLYEDYAELRHRIGFVPQENILHTQLTARRALRYAAELRFPPDTHARERTARVDEVMGELGLTGHAATRADKLSGGQLKRVNVALELLTKPSLLFLDEPTSGLDPGLDKAVMEQMRDLAHDGRTVIVVTHSVAHLDVCDRLLVLAPGGRLAYYGPPADSLGYFGRPGWAEVFQAFDREPGRDWAGEFARSRICAEYVTGPQRLSAVSAGPKAAGTPAPVRRGRLRQAGTLCRRYTRVIAADRGYLAFMALLPIMLGALIRAVAGQGLGGPAGGNADAQELLVMLVICVCLAGAACSIRELVKERPIYVRERAAGLSSGAYLCSKLAVLGIISVAQAVLVMAIGLSGRPMPAHGGFLVSAPLPELALGIIVLALASMCLGLLISAMVDSSEKAMPFLVLLTMAQVILSGGVLSITGKAGLDQLAWLAPSRWGFAAVAATTDLTRIAPQAPGLTADPLWAHQAGTWLADMAAMAALSVLFVLIAWWCLNRLSPGRRHR